MAVALAACGQASGHSGTPTASHASSPTPDQITLAYVALIHEFWIQEQAADVASSGSNLAAKVCLGSNPPGAPSDIALIDPQLCNERAVALLAVHEKFLKDLDTTPAPPKFASDDAVFRTQIPKTIGDLSMLISATKSGDRTEVLNAATAYNADMYPSVTDALNAVDPSVTHP